MVCSCNTDVSSIFLFPPTENWIQKPWGGYQEHYRAKDLSVCFKTLYIQAGHQLSYQYHTKRDELWYIPEEGAVFELNLEDNKSVKHGKQFIVVPKMVTHTIKNLSSLPLLVHEMSYGKCEEDDIIRVRDPYNRGSTK